MAPGRGQYTLGTLMFVVAGFAAVFATPGPDVRSAYLALEQILQFAYLAPAHILHFAIRFAYLGSVLIVLIACVLAVYRFVILPGFLLLDLFQRRFIAETRHATDPELGGRSGGEGHV